MNALTRQIQYMAETMHPRAIARETGVAFINVWSAINRDSSVSYDNLRGVTNAYRRTSYSNLKATGMSSNQATRFKSYAPAAVRDVTARMGVLTSDLIEGVFIVQKRAWDERGLAYNESTLRAISTNALIEGILNSDKTLEEWESYI